MPKFELIRTLSVAKVLDHFVVGTMKQTVSSVNLQYMSKSNFIVALNTVYSLMRARFGHLHWWPASDPFEVFMSAILTQILLDDWQDHHAQLVKIGKRFCRPRKPNCAGCPLESLLRAA